MARRRKDFYYYKAKREGYRSRAAYKLLQMQQRFKVIQPGDTVVDLGAAPGGWSQVAAELSGGRILAVDLQTIAPISDVETVRADITVPETAASIMGRVGEVDVVLCDAAPNLSGSWPYDHARSVDLAESALKVAEQLLVPGGNMVVKVFQGDIFPRFLARVRERFHKVQAHSPKASRSESAETYVVALGYRPAGAGGDHAGSVQQVEGGKGGAGAA